MMLQEYVAHTYSIDATLQLFSVLCTCVYVYVRMQYVHGHYNEVR